MISFRYAALALLGTGALAAPTAHAQQARVITRTFDLESAMGLAPATATAAPVSPVFVDSRAAPNEVFGHINFTGTPVPPTPTTPTDGFGRFNVTTPNVAPTISGPYPTGTTGGTATAGILKGGLFYFTTGPVATVPNDVYRLYRYNPATPAVPAVLVAPLTGQFDDEGAVGLQMNAAGQVKMVGLVCGTDGTSYFQSFLYDLDLTTGVASNEIELRDPSADGEGDTGVCLISFSWDGGSEIYGVDLVRDDLVRINATTGLLVERIADPNPGNIQDVAFVQSSAYDRASDTHYLFPFSRLPLATPTSPTTNIRASIYKVDPANVLSFVGFINNNTFPIELLTASFDNLAVATEAGPAGARVSLAAATPNPVSGASTMAFTLEAPADVRLTVFDVLGREVSVLASGAFGSGTHAVTIDASALAPGTYVARLVTGQSVVSRTLTVAR